MKWIKVDDELPVIGDRVLLCIGSGSIDFGWLETKEATIESDIHGNLFIGKKLTWSHGHQDEHNPFTDFEVTHWCKIEKPNDEKTDNVICTKCDKSDMIKEVGDFKICKRCWS